MGRNLLPRTKRNRRIGEKILTHGEKAFSRRSYPPGQHGPKGASRLSEYGIRLREKQKAQLMYGLLERQFRRYVNQARRQTGDTGLNLLQAFELRLDSIVYRAGFAPSHEAARQLVRHGKIMVNGRRVNFPSFAVHPGLVVSLIPGKNRDAMVQSIIKSLESYNAPEWMELDKAKAAAKILAVPTAENLASSLNPQLIVEFYSR